MPRASRFALLSACALSLALLAPSLASAQPSGLAPRTAPEPIPTEPSAEHPNVGERSGLTMGLSIGRGSIDVVCAYCEDFSALTEGLSLTAHIGWMINPKLALGVEHWTVRYNDRGTEWFDDSADHLVAQRITTVTAQVWLGNRLWLKAGAGLGKHISDLRYARLARSSAGLDSSMPAPGAPRAPVEADEPTGRYIPAATVAIGFEVARRTDISINVEFRAGTTRNPSDELKVHNTGFIISAAWFQSRGP